MQRCSASRSADPRVTGNPPSADSSRPKRLRLPVLVGAHEAHAAPRDARRDGRVEDAAVHGGRAGTARRPGRARAPRPSSGTTSRQNVTHDQRGRTGTRARSSRELPASVVSILVMAIDLVHARSASLRFGRAPRRCSARWCRARSSRRPASAGCRHECCRKMSRAAMAASISSTSPPASATRRSARTRGEAVRYSFSSASGNTTEPMSRPSMTPPPRRCAHARWRVDQLGAHAAVGGDAADSAGDLGRADLDRRVDAVDEHAVFAHLHGHRLRQVGNGRLVVEVEPVAQRSKRDARGTSPRCRGTRDRAAPPAPGRRCSCRRRRGRRWR